MDSRIILPWEMDMGLSRIGRCAAHLRALGGHLRQAIPAALTLLGRIMPKRGNPRNLPFTKEKGL
ncbi:hypothetical protein PSDVSF_10080 [Pseudodesulfovibrio sediminis]|uniref:Transposase DDE domain-containing protein n=1 Tax=Pseudodesulfovibrio sediminis TaxID=2810563 RepID=A0ABM7P4H8_9BACT|nr:hypothetical protein PSDVSF_10080 [Pseudodesulfovibrio sediminis]